MCCDAAKLFSIASTSSWPLAFLGTMKGLIDGSFVLQSTSNSQSTPYATWMLWKDMHQWTLSQLPLIKLFALADHAIDSLMLSAPCCCQRDKLQQHHLTKAISEQKPVKLATVLEQVCYQAKRLKARLAWLRRHTSNEDNDHAWCNLFLFKSIVTWAISYINQNMSCLVACTWKQA